MPRATPTTFANALRAAIGATAVGDRQSRVYSLIAGIAKAVTDSDTDCGPAQSPTGTPKVAPTHALILHGFQCHNTFL